MTTTMAKTNTHANLLHSFNKTALAFDLTISADGKEINIFFLLPVILPLLFPVMRHLQHLSYLMAVQRATLLVQIFVISHLYPYKCFLTYLLSPISLLSNTYTNIHLIKLLKCFVIDSLYLKMYHSLIPHNGDPKGLHNVHNVTFYPDTSPGTSIHICLSYLFSSCTFTFHYILTT